MFCIDSSSSAWLSENIVSNYANILILLLPFLGHFSYLLNLFPWAKIIDFN